MKAKRRVALTPWSLGSIPVTSIEIEQPKPTDPNAEREARLRTRAQELLVENEKLEREAEERRKQAIAAARTKAIESVKANCYDADEWTVIEQMVADQEWHWSQEDIANGQVYIKAQTILTGR